MQLKKLITLFLNIFYAFILKHELINIYNSDYKILCGLQLLAYIRENQLETVYKETVKLLKWALSIPVTSESSKHSMHIHKRVKTYLCNSTSNARPSNVSTLSSHLWSRGWRVIGISGSLIWSKTLMELIFNPCGIFQWSPVSQIHSSHLYAGAPGIFSDLLMSVQTLKREWGAESNRKLLQLFNPW